MANWPETAEELIAIQDALGRALPEPSYEPVADPAGVEDPAALADPAGVEDPAGLADPADGASIGGCFVCFAPDDRAFAGAALLRSRRFVAGALATGRARVPYLPGLLALREGALLEEAVRGLPEPPDLLLVNATGLDHPRRFGLACHLGMVLDLPTVGVTDRLLLASGGWPPADRGAHTPVWLDGEVVGAWVRTRAGVRPVAVHAGWRTSVSAALAVAAWTARRARTPEPLRRARQIARRARGRAGGTRARGRAGGTRAQS